MPLGVQDSWILSEQATLALTGEQRGELIQLRQLYLNKQAGISRQKTDVLHHLNQVFRVQPTLAGERASSSQHLKASMHAYAATSQAACQSGVLLGEGSCVLKQKVMYSETINLAGRPHMEIL